MTDETKILFEQLIDAINANQVEMAKIVEAINSPDWWTIGITTVNALIVIGLTIWQLYLNKRQTKIQECQNDLQAQQVRLQQQQNEIQEYQTKLQEQQVRAQEYEVYRRLYMLLGNANREIDSFIKELDWLLWQPWHNSNEGGLNRKKIHIDNLFNDLRDGYVDYELKLSKETFNKDGYLNILNLMSRVLQHTIDSLEKGEAHLSYGHQTIYNVNGDMVEGEIRHICSHFKEGMKLDALYQTLKQFTELRQKVRCDDSLLESIRAKCKID